MKEKHIWIIFVAFFSLIAIAVIFTKSAMPLWALLLTPSIEWDKTEEKDEKNNN